MRQGCALCSVPFAEITMLQANIALMDRIEESIGVLG
jgi:hypothetical protein